LLKKAPWGKNQGQPFWGNFPKGTPPNFRGKIKFGELKPSTQNPFSQKPSFLTQGFPNSNWDGNQIPPRKAFPDLKRPPFLPKIPRAFPQGSPPPVSP